jgi:hypothetical protein
MTAAPGASEAKSTAQAILDAFDQRYESAVLEDWMEPCIAVALQTLVDQVHYDEHLETHSDYTDKILAIANELLCM